VEILLWLVPPLVVTLVAMAWVSWLGRAGRGHVSRDEALRRMGAVLEQEPAVSHTVAKAPPEPSTGVALRRRSEPASREPGEEPSREPGHGSEQEQSEERRAS